VDLLRHFTHEQYEQALESWAWAGVSGKSPLAASLFGDVFLEGDEGVFYLDVLGGTLTREWHGVQEMLAALQTPDGQELYLMAGAATAAVQAGLRLDDDQVFDFIQNPALGGAMELSNIKATNFVVAVNIAGQIHDQLRGVPEGAEVRISSE
jgi:hypothetical protein